MNTEEQAKLLADTSEAKMPNHTIPEDQERMLREAHSAHCRKMRLPTYEELLASNEQLREALELECGDRCNREYNPCNARVSLNETPQQSLANLKARVLREAAAFCHKTAHYYGFEYGASARECARGLERLATEKETGDANL